MRTFVRILYAILRFLPYILCEIRLFSKNIFYDINRFLSFFHVLWFILLLFVDSGANTEPFTGATYFVTGLSRVLAAAALQGDCRLEQTVV